MPQDLPPVGGYEPVQYKVCYFCLLLVGLSGIGERGVGFEEDLGRIEMRMGLERRDIAEQVGEGT